MAEPVSSPVAQFVRTLFLAWILIAMPLARAEIFADPTRPPASIGQPQAGDAQKASGGPILQSVMMSPGRTEAIINGQTVKLGGKFGDSILVKISEAEVVLRTGNELQTLKLYPGIEKRTIPGGAASGEAAGKASHPGSKSDIRRQ